MRRLVLPLLFVVALGAANIAHAIPTAFYHPATGSIRLKNDLSSPLGAISIISANNSFKTDPALFASIPGATFDPGDLPLGFTYLNFPAVDANTATGIFIGNVITPGTPQATLSGIFYISLSSPNPQPVQFIFPEPSSGVIAVVAALGVALSARRRRQLAATGN